MRAADRSYESLILGEQVSFDVVIAEEDVATFAQLSGDQNPLHTDDVYAEATQFKKKVVHGMFLGALVSRLVGMRLPGRHALLLRESLEFKKPVMIGDTVTVTGTLVQKSDATRLIEIKVSITVDETVVARGAVTVRLLV